ncbi:hypothetical protein [Gloeocapsopsis dulcis]|uniref:Argininosuccinate lyase n=1 Tax=Gloeocapsopsis dulcis AAB1 = 1H9 TaxID=1433147 RepID=A0A6N8FNX7_9CHRO|nr:hypothetical protein [Gloeocapsopsis dulcis]MUL35023.1 hypothetical protein [Gloeocapsopsis dulcis AAB1 = 1H9]WNN89902.1 hypothetical protein P0S91_02050 [Gloeocapsopsis dulcis]
MLQNTLRKVVTVTSLLLPAVFTLNVSKALADQRDFRVHNKTSYAIVDLYVSDSLSDSWEKDLVPSGYILSSSNSDLIYFDGRGNSCIYDIKAVFSDGDTAEKYRVNLCQISDFTFFNKY